MCLSFFIPHEVKPKQSMRMANGVSYTPAKIKNNAKALQALLLPHRPKVPLSGPLRLDLLFQFPWRKSEPKKNRTRAWPKDTKPDFDNLCKQFCDVLQSMGFFWNDSQIADVRIRKVWTDSPGVQVMIEQTMEVRL